jgi:hypothetical protein
MKTNYVGLLKELFQRRNIGNTMTCGGLLVGIQIVGNYFGAKAVGEIFPVKRPILPVPTRPTLFLLMLKPTSPVCGQ